MERLLASISAGQYGIAGLLVIFLIILVWKLPEIIKSFKADRTSRTSVCALAKDNYDMLATKVRSVLIAIELANKTLESLLQLHSVKDEDGVPVWYFKPSLQKELWESMSHQTRFFEHFEEFIKDEYQHQKNMEEALLGLQKHSEIIASVLKDVLNNKGQSHE